MLLGALVLLLIPVWVEPAGSWLAEPDEARYAEIPREMLASGDFVTPRLNGVPYLEKPPLLYWANAASLRVFGLTPWAARLPSRFFGLGTVAVLVLGVASRRTAVFGLAAGVLYLASPLGFVFSRVNLTDAPLTFFLTASLFLGRSAIERHGEGLRWKSLAVLTGLAAAAGFLSKGLIALVLPGAILLLWAVAVGRGRSFWSLAFGPATLAFLAVAAPWFALAERRNPGFLQFFFIHEHFQRFATTEASRPGPIYYFAFVFLGGFLSGLPFFFTALRTSRGASGSWRRESDTLLHLLWFAVIFVFFSLSHSKLPPYLYPAFPSAAALSARALFGPRPAGRGSWIAAALLATVIPAWILVSPLARTWVREYSLTPIVIPCAAALLLGTWIAAAPSRRSLEAALLAFAAGWAAFGLMAALGWPRVPAATALHDLSSAAASAARSEGAIIAGYQTYVQSLPWELRAPVPLADYTGELEPWFERRTDVRDSLFWPREKFWSEWKSGRRYAAVARRRDLAAFERAGVPFRVLAEAPKHLLLANYQ
jgi:4-amino-4-deoxy-L-arabinose transferase-like glycosyltransferase